MSKRSKGSLREGKISEIQQKENLHYDQLAIMSDHFDKDVEISMETIKMQHQWHAKQTA